MKNGVRLIQIPKKNNITAFYLDWILVVKWNGSIEKG